MLKKKTKKTKECFHCGQIGHLAKQCSLLTEKPDNEIKQIYIPPKRIQFKSPDDLKEFKNRIHAFKYDSHQHPHLQAKLYQPVLKELLIYLTTQYGDCRKIFLLDPSQDKLAFTNILKILIHHLFNLQKHQLLPDV